MKRLRIGQKVEAKRQRIQESFEQPYTSRENKLEFRIDARETGLEPRCLGEEGCREYSGFQLEAFVTFLRNVDKRLKSQADNKKKVCGDSQEGEETELGLRICQGGSQLIR